MSSSITFSLYFILNLSNKIYLSDILFDLSQYINKCTKSNEIMNYLIRIGGTNNLLYFTPFVHIN